MATSINHVSFFWGALDINHESTTNPAYAPTDYVTLGDDATQGGGVGVRRVTAVLDRSAYSTPDDAANVHFDFLNLTSDDPDDTWTAADFASLEARIVTWWAAVNAYTPGGTKMTRLYWHRVGAGIGKPNPAVRITDIASPVSSASSTFSAPPQAACSLSLRHGSRRSWGRTYLPLAGGLVNGRLSSPDMSALRTATAALLTGAKTDDFIGVVTSVVHSQAFVIERVVVDNIVDVVRNRRFKKATLIQTSVV